MIIIIIGVSGCGKTSLGSGLADRLGLRYFEADSFHPAANIEKMSCGKPLNDEDRWPWLGAIRSRVAALQKEGQSAVFTCSALKESYRAFLGEGLAEPVEWVYLKGTYEVIFDRMISRKDHYFKAEMLKSQFADLEEPENAFIMDIEIPLKEKVNRLEKRFSPADNKK